MRTINTLACFSLFVASIVVFTSCENPERGTSAKVATTAAAITPITADVPVTASGQKNLAADSASINLGTDAASVLARPQVPILCYHQIRDWRDADSKQARDYIVPVDRFKEQMQMLADSGYHTILPDQLLAYLTSGAPLPENPVMLTFDDTNLDQYSNALPVLEKHGFKAVFFVMTVSLNRPRYMTKEQVKDLSEKGHVIGSHTWDHQNVKKYEGTDWETQVAKPKRVLEQITGKPVTYFAYPFGLWNQQAIPQLRNHGVTAAFQLADKRDEHDPLYTIRRIIASGYWNSNRLHRNMEGSFK